MSARPGNADHGKPRLLPPDVPARIPADHLVMDAVGPLAGAAAEINERGTGEADLPERRQPGGARGDAGRAAAFGVCKSDEGGLPRKNVVIWPRNVR
jgi:hypothetical protein